MVSLNDAKADAAALRDFVTKTGFARYAVSGSAAPGEAFTIHQRDRRREGFGNSSSQITLPAGNYRVMLFDSIWSEGTANPQSIVVDLYDVGAAAVVVSFSVDRPSADPSDAVGIADPLLYVEDDVTLVGPIELRNGGSANQRAALVARIWPLPESWPRPDPQALYFRTWHLTRPVGASLGLFGAFELDDENVRRSIKTVDATSQVPWGANGPPPGDYQVQVTGTLKNLSSAPATLSIRLHSDDDLLFTESIGAAAGETVAVEVDETIALSGRFDVRSGSADQAVDLLLKVWRLP